MKKFISALILAFSFMLCSCGQNTEEILTFQTELNDVILNMESIHTQLNMLDVSDEDAADIALDYLSDLKKDFDKLAAIKVTDENHSYITQLAEEGADHMAQAYDLFQAAYSGDTFDEASADLAYQHLERATTRIRVIVNMLHGEIPDGAIVH